VGVGREIPATDTPYNSLRAELLEIIGKLRAMTSITHT
jgi:hypothetical protein